MSGYLEIIIGCMWSGKSTRLLNIYEQLIKRGENPIIINHKMIKNESSTLTTHDDKKIKCIFLDQLYNRYIPPDIKYILINEGQFFPDLYTWVKTMVNTYNKHIYIAGLNGDFEKKGFTNILSLVPECDSIIKLNAICSICSKDAIFTHRKTSSKEQIIVNSEIYQPLCRNCYNKSI